MAKCPVNSWNEWDPLEEVVVGSVANYKMYLDCIWYATGFRYTKGDNRFRINYPDEWLAAATREEDNLVRLLQNEGVVVRRPTVPSVRQNFETPYWSSPSGIDGANPRDVLLVVGNEIIEAPRMSRSHYFDSFAYLPLMKEYFHAGACWTAAPKISMSDELYRVPFEAYKFASDDLYPAPKSEQRRALLESDLWITTEFEPAWDAADCLRCGKDIFAQRSLTSNSFGIKWLARHLEPKGVRVHEIRCRDEAAWHIDATLTALRPGLIMANPDKPCLNIDIFKSNGWTVVDAPRPSGEFPPGPRMVSNWIAMNVLSISPDTVIVEEKERLTIETLKSLGFRVISVPFQNCYRFVGGLHCHTLDVRRRGNMENYFPDIK
jgi:glycine amidinotransferase